MNSPPYSQLACIYDKVMNHVDYKKWSDYVINLFKYTENNIHCILDLSCGTGKHLQHIRSRDTTVFGADYSLAMLKQAKKRKLEYLAVSDAGSTCFKNSQFDVVVMLYDSINYVLEEEKVVTLLNDVKRILKTGGIFIFDFVTAAGLKGDMEDYFETNSWGGFAYERHSWYSAKDQVQHNEFILLYRGKSYKEEHIQKIRSSEEWKNIILKSDMHLCREFSNFSYSKPTRLSQRVHMICKKEKR